MSRRIIGALLMLFFLFSLPTEILAQSDSRPTIRVTGEQAPLTRGLLTNWLTASGYVVVDMPARYECRLNGFINQSSGGGGNVQTPWFRSQTQSNRVAIRVLFTLYDDSRRVFFDSAIISAGRAQTNFNVSGSSGSYSTTAWGYGDTTPDAIIDFFTHLPAAPPPRPEVTAVVPIATTQTVTTLWVDMTHNNQRAVISGPPGTKFWTRFFAIKQNGSRGNLTSCALRTIDDRGWYILWNEADAARNVDIIIDGEAMPRRTIILLPGGKPGPNENF